MLLTELLERFAPAAMSAYDVATVYECEQASLAMSALASMREAAAERRVVRHRAAATRAAVRAA